MIIMYSTPFLSSLYQEALLKKACDIINLEINQFAIYTEGHLSYIGLFEKGDIQDE